MDWLSHFLHFSPGDRIATDRYTYANFIELAQLYHLEIVPIDFDEQGMRPDILIQECRKRRFMVSFLCLLVIIL